MPLDNVISFMYMWEMDVQEGLGVDGRTILECSFKGKGINTGNCVDSAQDRNYWRALVNAALNLRVPQAMELYIIKKLVKFQD